MPKYDQLRKIDDSPVRYIKPASPDYGQSQAGGQNADTLDGYHATTVPSPNAIPVTDGAGYISPFVNPETALTGNQGAAWSGMRYIAPSARLMDKITASSTSITVSAPLFAGDESAILSHYSVPNEKVWIMGAGSTDGKQWTYTIERGKGGTTAQVFPEGSEVINLGSTATGGFIYTSSAQNTDSPFIAMRQNNDDETRSSTWKAQFGKLSSMPETFKALFPTQDNWDRFGIAAQDAYFDGGVHARYGQIAGLLSVTGQLYVNDTLSNARMEMGYTPTGWGQIFRDTFGQPVWSVVMPWPDNEGNRPSDIVWTVNSFGERAIYFRREGDEWVLSLGGFDITETSMTNGNFGIYPSEKRIQLGGSGDGAGLITWQDIGEAGYPTLSIGSSRIEITGRDYVTFYTSYGGEVIVGEPGNGEGVPGDGRFRVNGSTTSETITVTSTNDGSLAVSAPPAFQYTSGTSSASPETDAEAGWLEVVVNGETRYIPLYA